MVRLVSLPFPKSLKPRLISICKGSRKCNNRQYPISMILLSNFWTGKTASEYLIVAMAALCCLNFVSGKMSGE